MTKRLHVIWLVVLVALFINPLLMGQCKHFAYNPFLNGGKGGMDCVSISVAAGADGVVGASVLDTANRVPVVAGVGELGQSDVSLASGIFSRAGTLGLSATGANVVTFSTNGVERGRFTSGGSLAINSTGVVNSEKLFIQATGASDTIALGLDNNDTSGTSTVSLTFSQGGSIKSRIKTAVYGNDYMAFHVGSDTEAMRISAGRRLLIGTTTDDGSSKLQVAGVITTNGAGGGVQINTRNSGANWTQYVNAGTLTLYNGSADIFTLSSAGTATLYNQTATTGVTSFVVRAGAGQSTTNLITLQYNGGTEVTGIRTDQTTWVQNIHHFGSSLSTSDVRVTLGNARSGNGNSYIDLITDATYTTYGLRILRDNAGANGDSSILHRGTGVLSVNAFDAGSVDIKANNTSRLKVNNTGIGFFGVTPVARQTATADAASILALLQAYGLSN